jgi:two-component sensor histidine kinase
MMAGLGRPGSASFVLIMVHDATEERRRSRNSSSRPMIQEIHHRVKNNLQTIAAMLKCRPGAPQKMEALMAINEAISHSERGGDP